MIRSSAQPLWSLSLVRELVEGGNYRTGRARCEETVSAVVLDYSKTRELIRCGLLELTENDFAGIETLSDGLEFDVYGLFVSKALAKKMGLQHRRTWYVKFRVQMEDDGNVVFCVSFHRLEKSLERKGGVLAPSW